MNWLNLRVSFLRAPEYVGCDPVQRATWLNVLGYCVEQENGGCITDARQWKCRQWQQTCGVMIEEIEGAAPLLTWSGDDLVVWSYPLDKETEVQIKRSGGRSTSEKKVEAARKNGSKGGRPKTHGNPRETQAETHGKPTGAGDHNPSETQAPEIPRVNPTEKPNETDGKPKEGKGKEEEGKDNPLPPEGDGKKRTPATPEALRIHTLFRRRPDNGWDRKQIRAFKCAVKDGLMTAENLDLIEPYYEAQRAKGERGLHRRDMSTFLNNFSGELDRARAFADETASPANDGYTEV